jgi:hypothetical protein
MSQRIQVWFATGAVILLTAMHSAAAPPAGMAEPTTPVTPGYEFLQNEVQELRKKVERQTASEQFDHYTSAAQHIIAALGIVAAGGWAYYTFRGQRSIQKANLDVSTAQAQIRKLEQDAFQEPVLSTTLTEGTVAENGEVVSLNVRFGNEGTLTTKLRDIYVSIKQIYDQSGNKNVIQVNPVKIEENGSFADFVEERFIRPGQERNMTFILPELPRGAYFVELRATYSGVVVKDGRFRNAPHTPTIVAIEQLAIVIPSREILRTPKVLEN